MWSNVSAEAKDLIGKLLQKDPAKRIKIKDVLDHKWITNDDVSIKELRKKSQDTENKVMEFVAYSNVNVEKVKENSPRAAEKHGLQLNSLAGSVQVQSNFANMLKAKNEGG